MSLILEALKKSERERLAKTRSASSLVTAGPDDASPEPRHRRWAVIALAVLLVANLCIVYFFMRPATTPSVATNHAEPADVVVIEEPEPRPELRAETQTEPLPFVPATPLFDQLPPTRETQSSQVRLADKENVQPITDNDAPPIPEEFAALEVTPVAQSNDVLSVNELSDESLIQRLQQYEVNTHIFNSNDATRSFVLINMQKYREGDSLHGSQYTISSINADGVVVDTGDGQVLLTAN